MPQNESRFARIAEHAMGLIRDGYKVGLGTGKAATEFIQALGKRVQAGLLVQGVPTSRASASLARELRIPLADLADVMPLDLTVDGADEVDPSLNLIKGLGGALVREKIVAAASKRLVILVGPEKLVPVLGKHGVLPVEVVPFGLPLCRRRLHELGFEARPRQTGGDIFVTDNGNNILDCTVGPMQNPGELDQAMCYIPGVVGTGLFVGMAHTVLVQDGERVDVMQRKAS